MAGQKLMRFRLVGGSHSQWDPKYAHLKDAEVRAKVEELVREEIGFPDEYDRLNEIDKKRWSESLADALRSHVLDRRAMLLKLGAEQRFVPGQIVESTEDMAARFVNKFVRLSGSEVPDEMLHLREELAAATARIRELEAAREVADELEAMDVPALRKLAKDQEIDLGSAKLKAEIISVLREESLARI